MVAWLASFECSLAVGAFLVVAMFLYATAFTLAPLSDPAEQAFHVGQARWGLLLAALVVVDGLVDRTAMSFAVLVVAALLATRWIMNLRRGRMTARSH